MDYSTEAQFAAVVRAAERLYELAADAGTAANMDYRAEDAARHFFHECYALKDYLKKDPRVAEPAVVEQFVSGSIPLSLAADVCNSIKHRGLDRRARGSGPLDGLRMETSLELPTRGQACAEGGKIVMQRNPRDGDVLRIVPSPHLGRSRSTVRVALLVAGKSYDACQVAQDCILAWVHVAGRLGVDLAAASDE